MINGRRPNKARNGYNSSCGDGGSSAPSVSITSKPHGSHLASAFGMSLTVCESSLQTAIHESTPTNNYIEIYHQATKNFMRMLKKRDPALPRSNLV